MRVPAQQFRLEADVERYVAEPLLRRLVAQVEGATLVRQKQLTKLVPDYAVKVGGRVVLVVEVKQRITRRRGQDWDEVMEAKQLRRYMRAVHWRSAFRSRTAGPIETGTSSGLRPTDGSDRCQNLPSTGSRPSPRGTC